MAVFQYLGARSVWRTTKGRSNQWDSFTPPTQATLNASGPLVRWAYIVHLDWCAQFWDQRAFTNFSFKKRISSFFSAMDLTIVAPSKWMSRHAQSSPLFTENLNHVVIYYEFDECVFHPLDARFCWSLFSLPMERKMVLVTSYLGPTARGWTFFRKQSVFSPMRVTSEA